MTLGGGWASRAGRSLFGGLVVAGLACSSPTVVTFPPLEVVVASGNGQYGTSGQVLTLPLQVSVRTLSSRLPQEGASVLWEVTAGDAVLVDIATTLTDSTGSARMRVRLGSTVGPVEIRATVQHVNQPDTTFDLFLVDRPTLTDVTPNNAVPGAAITLTGANFSPSDPTQNVVLFSGVRGRVLSASETELTVEVPACLPTRAVSVSVQLGVVASGMLPFSVGPGGTLVNLQVGEILDVADDGGFECLRLPGDGAEYLTLVYSAATVGAAKHPFELTGLSSAGPLVTTLSPADHASSLAGARVLDAQSAWDMRLREHESVLLESGPTSGRRTRGGSPAQAPAAVPPAVGTRRTFQVFEGDGDFATVTAIAQLVSDEAALFVDENAPAGGFIPADLQLFADRFDDVIHPAVTGVFGNTSDLDNNQRVVILMTPVVNALTPRGSSGFIGGFFFGVDLLPDQAHSNKAEIFYTLVPDPNGDFSDPHTKGDVLGATPAILAHEFQHMVHFNERVVQLGAESTEAVWLSEGLAQYAEEVVALDYEAAGDAPSASLFRTGTRDRSRRYLRGPDTVSVIIATGQGSLAERGAGFLYVTYLEDQLGTDLLGRLTRTTRTGVTNLVAETGREWEDVLVDWWSAVYLDGLGLGSGALEYPDVDLRGFLGNPFPLDAVGLGAGDFTQSGSLWSSSAGYYIVSPPSGGSTTLRLGGEGGGVSAPQAVLRMRVIRTS